MARRRWICLVLGCLAAGPLLPARAGTGEPAAPFRLVRYGQDHGTLRLDRSFIDAPLRIGSRRYARGLGTHAHSRMEIALGAACRQFRAEVGVDLNEPTEKAGGSAVFLVTVDGRARFRSKVLQPGMEPVAVSVDLTGAKRLELIAEVSTNGYVGDHADWADARIVLADGRELLLSQAFRRQGLPANRRTQHRAANAEPETRSLTAAEARRSLEQDWLFQAGHRPTLGRIRQEIGWARGMADRLATRPDPPDVSAELAALVALEARAVGRPATSGAPTLPAGLVGHWGFDAVVGRVVEDGACRGCRGSLVGRAKLAEGVAGRGLALNGGIVVTSLKPGAVAKGSYTACAWVRTTVGVADVLGNGTESGDFLIVINGGPVRVHHWTDGSANVFDGKAVVNDGRWHHVAQVVDDASIALYVDGKLDLKQKLVGSKTASASPVCIGSRSPDERRYRFRGCVDEVCLFGRALAPDELKALHDGGRKLLADVERVDIELYLAVRRVKRRILFADPLIDFSQVLFVDVYNWYPHESMHRVWPNAQENTGRLLLLDGLHPGGTLRKLAGPEPGMFWRPELSFDGRKVLFCYRPQKDRTFHLYEIGIDGSGLRQVTHGSYDDLDPVYLPDGKIAFLTNRGNSYARCAVGHPSYVLARCDANGKDLYILSASNEPEYTPALLHNGRVLYTRWEYTDKELMRIQSLWTVNPDGTGVSAFWGNQSYWPDMQLEARPIPGSRRVMFAGHGHHQVFLGCIGILDPKLGFNYPDGLTKVTADVPWPEVGDGPAEKIENPAYHASGRFVGYKSPYPLSEDLFLVSARPHGGQHRLYLMDVLGNKELIYAGAFHVLYAQPIRPRPKPPAIPDTVAWPGSEKDGGAVEPGVVYSPNVFEGVPDALRAKAKYVRVINLDYTTYTYGLKTQGYSHWRGQPHMHAGPPVSITCNDGIKRILGTVPIEADGSVSIEVPPAKQLHLQLLDGHYRALQTMRSFANVMPGERRGCLGCHELHSVTPPVHKGIALDRPPAKPTPPPWGPTYSLGYERDVQPILDKHCGKCHQGDGKGRKKLDLTLRPSKDAGAFPEPYVTLTLGARRSFPGSFPAGEGGVAGTIIAENRPWRPQDYATLPPMTKLSYTSKLIYNAMSGKHNGVKLDPLSLRKLIVWVDILCPYLGEPEIRALPDPDPKDPRFANSGYPPRTPGIRAFIDSPYPPRLRNAPVVNRAYCQDDFPTQAHRLK